MKKLMVMFAAVAMAASAMAVGSHIRAYEKDSIPANANASWYSCYFMDLEAIKAATANSVTTVDITTYSTWLQASFSANVTATKNNASLAVPASSEYVSGWGQYAFEYDTPTFEEDKAFLAVCFFDNDTDHAFKIARDTNLIYAIDDHEVVTTSWIPAPSTEAIPEPTSGLMLLLGLAGLALKRKVA